MRSQRFKVRVVWQSATFVHPSLYFCLLKAGPEMLQEFFLKNNTYLTHGCAVCVCVCVRGRLIREAGTVHSATRRFYSTGSPARLSTFPWNQWARVSSCPAARRGPAFMLFDNLSFCFSFLTRGDINSNQNNEINVSNSFNDHSTASEEKQEVPQAVHWDLTVSEMVEWGWSVFVLQFWNRLLVKQIPDHTFAPQTSRVCHHKYRAQHYF